MRSPILYYIYRVYLYYNTCIELLEYHIDSISGANIESSGRLAGKLEFSKAVRPFFFGSSRFVDSLKLLRLVRHLTPKKKPPFPTSQIALLDRILGTNRRRWTLHIRINECLTDKQRCVFGPTDAAKATMGHCTRVRWTSI